MVACIGGPLRGRTMLDSCTADSDIATARVEQDFLGGGDLDPTLCADQFQNLIGDYFDIIRLRLDFYLTLCCE